MEEINTLYDLFTHCSTSSFNVVFYNFGNIQTMNYKQINSHICDIADILESEIAVHSVIGCLIRPGISIPAVILGILKKSSSFVFLDVRKPTSSLKILQNYVPVTSILVEEFLLKDFQEKLCCCWKKRKTILSDVSPLILLQSSECSIDLCPTSKMSYPNFAGYASKLAYIIQTSGTTGEPKIVQVPNQCIVPNIIDLKHKFEVTSSDVLLLCSPLTFDPSIIELFLAILSGCTLVIIPDQLKSIPKRIISVITDSKITIIQATPTLVQSFGEHFIKDFLLSKDSNLRVLAFGGEACPSSNKLRRWKSNGNRTKIFNLYGLTEVSCWASCYKVDLKNIGLSSDISLGQPLLKTHLELSKEGELFIGGDKRWCIINDEAWPSHESQVMRPTGDLAIQASDGLYYFIGRKDNIVKYKGQKLSLHQINSILEDIPEILNHFTHFDHKTSKLLLFVVQGMEANLEMEKRQEIIKVLRKSISNLPPTEVITVPYIPLTKHGKSDYRKLFEFANSECQQIKFSNRDSCSNYIEIISNLWKGYTNQQTISDDDNFVMNGGDSVLALQFASDIEWKFQVTSPELVEKLLNDSFKDVTELVKTYFSGIRKINYCQRSLNSSEEECPRKPASKKVCLDRFKCYEMSSRRGYSLICAHSGACGGKEIELLMDAGISLKMMCKFDMKKCVDASPCVVRFVGFEEILAIIGSHSGLFCCINVSKEVLKWTVNLPDRIESSPCLSSCGNYVFVGCYDHHLYCFDIETGIIRWKLFTGAEVKSSPVASSQNIIFVGSHDKHLYAVKAEIGELLWKKLISKGSIFSSPALSDAIGSVAVATLDGVLAVLKMDTGAIIWTYNYGKPLFSSPLFTSTSIFIGATNNCLLHFDLSGTLVSEHRTNGPVFSTPILASSPDNEQIIFGCHDCRVYCIGPNSECLWQIVCDSPVYATPFTFQWIEKKYVVIASTSGEIYILTQSGGKVVYSWKCPGEVFSSPVVLNNFLIIGCRDNYMYCFRLSAVT